MLLMVQASWAERAVVLVASKDFPADNISTLDTRKIYLGVSVAIDGKNIRAIRWYNDERLNQIFLQSVIAMSHRSYERRLLSMVLKFGSPRPVEVDGQDELVAALAKNPMSIAYMWKRDAESDTRLKIIRVLWQEN